MKAFFSVLLLCIGFNIAFAQTGTISGKVKSSAGIPVEGGTVHVLNTNLTGSINSNGEFIIRNLKPGTYTLSIRSIGYSGAEKAVAVTSDITNIDIVLNASSSTLREVIVSSGRVKETLGKTPVSVTILNSEEIKTQAGINPPSAPFP